MNGLGIVDNDVLSLSAMRSCIEKRLPDLPIAWCTNDGYTAVDRCISTNTRPAILLTDMSLNSISGLRICHILRTKMNEMPILGITSFPIEQYEARAAQAGAQGILAKIDIPTDIGKAVLTLLQGKTWSKNKEIHFESAIQAHSRLQSKSCNDFGPLSFKEAHIMNLCLEGYSLTEIAQKLNLSAGTIRAHASHIRDKLGAKNLSQATACWMSMREDLDNTL